MSAGARAKAAELAATTTLSQRQIAKQVGLTRDEVKRLVRDVRGGQPSTPAPVPLPKGHSPHVSAAAAFLAFIGHQPLAWPPKHSSEHAETYALMSDLHAPFHNHPALLRAVAEAEAAGCSTLVLGGDTFDFYALSRYHKTKQIRFEDELAKCRALLEFLGSRFTKVLIGRGNHDQGRWERVLADEVSEGIRFLVRSPWDVLLAGLDNIELVGHSVKDAGEMVWLAQIGKDAIVTHCELSSAQQGVNLERLKQWLHEWAPALGFCDRPRFITTGHTHRATMHHEFDRVLVETGTLASADAQGYQFHAPGGAQLRNRKPGVYAWTYFAQVDGVTDLRSVRVNRLRA